MNLSATNEITNQPKGNIMNEAQLGASVPRPNTLTESMVYILDRIRQAKNSVEVAADTIDGPAPETSDKDIVVDSGSLNGIAIRVSESLDLLEHQISRLSGL